MVKLPVFTARWARFWAAGAVIALTAAAGLTAGGAWAQDAPPPPALPPVVAPETEPVEPGADASTADPLAEIAPYKNWKHHDGAPKDSVVLVCLTDASGTTTTVSGFVLRCDGFAVVPKTAIEAWNNHATLSVAPTPTATETDDVLTTPLPVAGRLHSGAAEGRTDYGLLKVNGHHLRCLHPLTARVLQAGMPVRIVCAVPDPRDPAHSAVRLWDATVGEAVSEPGSAGSAGAVHWGLSGMKATNATDTPAAPPSGAAVIDTESGAVVGILTQTGDAPLFSSWARLGDVVSEVGIAPSRASVKRVLDPSGPARIAGTGVLTGRWRKGEMVRIAGGPVRLSGKLALEYRSAYHTDIACTPDFYLDVYPVSLEEYRAWLTAHPNQSAPLSWLPGERETPERRQDLPATGMTVREAGSFAADRDARLVTEVEWLRGAARLSSSALALLHSQGEIQREVAGAWDKVLAQFAAARQERAVIAKAQNWAGGSSAGAGAVGPEEGAIYSLVQAFWAWLRAFVAAHGGHDWSDLPGLMVPLDHNDADVSVHGIRHVAMNAPEMLLPRGVRTAYAPKVQPANLDPYLSIVGAQWYFAASLASTTDVEAALPVSGSVRKRVVDLEPSDTLGWAGLFLYASLSASGAYVNPRAPAAAVTPRSDRPPRTASSNVSLITTGMEIGGTRIINAGFRCAD